MYVLRTFERRPLINHFFLSLYLYSFLFLSLFLVIFAGFYSTVHNPLVHVRDPTNVYVLLHRGRRG